MKDSASSPKPPKADAQGLDSANIDLRTLVGLQAIFSRFEDATDFKLDAAEPAASVARVDAQKAGSRYMRHI